MNLLNLKSGDVDIAPQRGRPRPEAGIAQNVQPTHPPICEVCSPASRASPPRSPPTRPFCSPERVTHPPTYLRGKYVAQKVALARPVTPRPARFASQNVQHPRRAPAPPHTLIGLPGGRSDIVSTRQRRGAASGGWTPRPLPFRAASQLQWSRHTKTQ